MNINEMLEQLGSVSTEQTVHDYYDEQSLEEILKSLNDMFPDEDCEELAEAIYEFCKHDHNSAQGRRQQEIHI